ncbi:MAG: saccharopine dehydrogenase C-terminal domain-containing protein [Phycisphaerales bacterium]
MPLTRAIVLGAGMVGSVMAADLASDPAFDVTVADLRPANLAAAKDRAGGKLKTVQADLSNAAEVKKLVANYDLVLGAIASSIGLQTLRAVIEAGRNYCDITFMAEDAIDLDDLARRHNVTAIVDCGVAPGMSHMISGAEASAMDSCENIEIYVGGLPRERRWPFQYKAPFSPGDVIEEYTRPSRLVEHGKVVIREALSEPELMNFPGVGTLEAFNTDGLRSLARTFNVPFMKEKTLRYPGHIELMRVLRATGLFSTEPVDVNGVKVAPRDLLAKLMFPLWTFQPGEEDVTVMRIIVDGTKNNRRTRVTWDLHDTYHAASRATSMSRTTAFPCTIMARLLASGEFRQKGVIVPELIGKAPGILTKVIDQHRSKGVNYSRSETPLDGSLA